MPKKLALSLSGGGARAFCYLGFIDALLKNHIQIHTIAAHSGAAIALCYYFGLTSNQDRFQTFSHFSYKRFISLNPLHNRGLLNTHKLISYLDNISHNLRIQDLPINTIIHATDISDYDHPKKISLTTGKLARAAAISSIVPPIFPSFHHKKLRLIDGGFTSLYSASELKNQGANIVIGLYPDALNHTPLIGIAAEFAHTIKSLSSAREIHERESDPVDLEIRNFTSKAGLNDYHQAESMYQSGFHKATHHLPQIHKLLHT